MIYILIRKQKIFWIQSWDIWNILPQNIVDPLRVTHTMHGSMHPHYCEHHHCNEFNYNGYAYQHVFTGICASVNSHFAYQLRLLHNCPPVQSVITSQQWMMMIMVSLVVQVTRQCKVTDCECLITCQLRISIMPSDECPSTPHAFNVACCGHVSGTAITQYIELPDFPQLNMGDFCPLVCPTQGCPCVSV